MFGQDIDRNPGPALRHLGIVFQARTLDLDLSVRQNLLYHASLHGIGSRVARQRIDELLRSIDMSDRIEEKVRGLSGGQIRRVEIVRALLHRPSLLLLDEATVGLDIKSRATILRDIRALVEHAGISVLWATHLIDEVGQADQILVLDQGKLVADGPVSAILAPHRHGDHQSGILKAYRYRGHEYPGRKTMSGATGTLGGATAGEWKGFTPIQYLVCLRGILFREWLRYLSQKERFVSSLVRPLLWLFIFAAGFRQVLGVSIIPPYETYVLYEVYITPGLCGMILLFSGMQSSLSMVYDREMGNMRILLVSPFPRWYLLVSKLLAGVAVSLLQVYAFLAIAWFWDVKAPIAGYFMILPALFLRADAWSVRDALVIAFKQLRILQGS